MRRTLRPIRLGAVGACLLVLASLVAAPSAAGAAAPARAWMDASLKPEARAELLLAAMTLEEKVGQMTQAERGPSAATRRWSPPGGWDRCCRAGARPRPRTRPRPGPTWSTRLQRHALATRLGIPLVYGVDSVHGHGNLVGAVSPTSASGRPATPSWWSGSPTSPPPDRATGPQWIFALRLYVAGTCAGPDLRELRGGPGPGHQDGDGDRRPPGPAGPGAGRADKALATAKHYAGDGDTEYGTAAGDYTIDQGITVTSRRDFARIDLSPYVAAVHRHDVGSVMPSFSSVDWTDDGVGDPLKMHAHRELVTGVLKGRIGFDGFVISDWEGIHSSPATTAQVRTGVSAGIDMFMEPFSYQAFETTLLAEVAAGRVPVARVDDAVRRILAKKFELGLFQAAVHRPDPPRRSRLGVPPCPGPPRRRPVPGAAEEPRQGAAAGRPRAGLRGRRQRRRHRQPGRRLDGGLAGPVRRHHPRQHHPGGSARSPLTGGHLQRGRLGPHGRPRRRHRGRGRDPYAEGFGDVGGPQWQDDGVPREPKTMRLNAADRAAVDRVCGEIRDCVVVVVSGRPLVLTDQLGRMDALVAAWLPGSQGEGVADVLFGRRPFTGRLSMTWPRTLEQEPINVGDRDYDPLFPYGWGLRTRADRSVSGALVGPATIGWYGKGPELAPSSAPRQRQAVQDGCP